METLCKDFFDFHIFSFYFSINHDFMMNIQHYKPTRWGDKTCTSV